MPTFWSDVSQYQGQPIDGSYPHPIFSFRTNTGSVRDTLALENARRAKDLDKLEIIMPYYFFRPGAANCDLCYSMIIEAGLRDDPRVVVMVDVESGNGSSQGSIPNIDHSREINDEIARLRKWFGPKRVVGYLNGVADAHLWRNIPADLPMVTPSYSGRPGVWASTPPPKWLQDKAFGHQFTDTAITRPWPRGTDLNWSRLDIADIKALLGVTTEGGSSVGAVEDGAAQLAGRFGNVRKPVNPDNIKYLPRSFNPATDPKGPAFNDMVAAIVNEVVWDGYDINIDLADLPLEERRSLVGLVRTIAAKQVVLEGKLDRLLGEGNS
ncbi:endolysin [Gordonia phage Mayweather]|uniref:Lysin A, glycosyl hydrolase domain n=1 Tax=Gordonia phage Mayweather TaxID=2590931 RepID=A0A516KU33_9CAUD|nr:endolysin [Gordonia phage Mayweather]QDP45184.1 lysin A, glycosyl hydrolase domain [Gordonia phage Mayweather]